MTENIEPRVWLGCLACYNGGHLTGKWLPPEEAAEATPETIHTGDDLARMRKDEREGYGPHEEMWVMDQEYTGVTGEFGLQTCQSIAEAYERVGEHQWAAYLGYCTTGAGASDDNGVTDPSSFEDAYAGEWDSFRDFAIEQGGEAVEQYVSSIRDPYAMGRDKEHLDAAIEFLTSHFDYGLYERELDMDHYTARNPEGGVFIYRSM